MSEKLKKMGEACGCSPQDVEQKLIKHGLTEATAVKADAAGINIFTLLQLFNTYGPVAINIINDIIARLKQAAPMQSAQNSGEACPPK